MARRTTNRRLSKAAFWGSVGLVAWTHFGYGAFLAGLRRRQTTKVADDNEIAPSKEIYPKVSLIIAAYREQDVIAAKVENALSLSWPRDRLEIIVAVDGGADPDSADATAQRARAAGADKVLELAREGKVRAQDAAVAIASGDFLAFSDANSAWDPDALSHLLKPFSDSKVGYVCGRVHFVNEQGDNQEGLYWRYDMWLRKNESDLASVTAGNGAIYAVRPHAYFHADPVMGHDLSFPFNMVKRGWRAVYAQDACATEKMVPSIEGEWRRKRRMMSHAWPIVLRGGLLSNKGYDPLYAVMVHSHRTLRYLTPFLHFVIAALTLRLLPVTTIYRLAAGVQIALVTAAFSGSRVRSRPFLLARYYLLTTAAIGAGLYDHLKHGTAAGWDAPEGTR